MVQTIPISEQTTLKYLRQNFNLQRNDERQFFPEWYENLSQISDADKIFLDKVRSRYFYQLDEGALLESGVKMMIVSPLLDIAGFYDTPFKTRFEPSVTLQVETEEEILQGRIDALVLQNQFWVWVLEAKRTTFSLSLGIPQALAYMLCHPDVDKPTFGILTGGEDFIFIKLVRQQSPIYGLSRKFSIINEGDLYEVLKIMRHMGELIATS
ncbi:type I restriction endonuclease subunit R [Scytonema hofmannii PCC 7110]|uniref:Type I restriction endonuclease subunit R n=1 Tax=Scytonema hofmannii PCC 7110 TaxID=128403 RepID=A0A139WWM8_9CYAN|nr:type I restriction endonuclease [Scytonema hofmannii]KYC36849.1 type I restriction endonuclease subunit R [Scytonema hofmannii PCC 7110]